MKRPPIIALAILGAIVIAAVAAPLITRGNPLDGHLANALRPPAWMPGGSVGNFLGTDKLGRDILTRLIYGARASITVAFVAIAVAGTIGTTVGVVVGYLGGVIDMVAMRLVDLTLSMPMVLMALVFSVIWGPGFGNVIVILILFLWAQYARQIRAEVLTIRELAFVKFAFVAGTSTIRILTQHVFPNILSTLLILAILQVGRVILLEASLSFLGVGLPPPQPAWGLMIADGRGFIHSAWWISICPGVALVLAIMSFNLVGDWLRDIFDPKMRSL